MKDKKTKPKKDFILVLPNIRSAINVGAIFRTADAVGISKIYLTDTPLGQMINLVESRKILLKVLSGLKLGFLGNIKKV